MDAFFQREPVEGAPPTERTEVRVLFDDRHLYFALRCFDSEAGRLVANQMRRDADLEQNDNIQIILDPYNDRRGGFYFSTNPLGARQDLLLTDEGRTRNRAWDSVWQSRTRIDSLGWSAEVAIPFDQVRYPDSDEAVWGINIGRAIRRRNEEVFLVPPPQSYGYWGRYRTSRLAVLKGLGRLRSRPPMAVVPFLLSGTRRDFTAENSSNEYDLDPGLDFKYGLTPSLTLDLSWKTDFAQVEADQEQVNLTRFNLFFPEKRDFFLEGAGIFEFGERVERQGLGGRPPTLMFYSRRIGIEEGHNLPVLAGGKLTGRAGPYQVGTLRMTTQAMTFVDEEEEDRFLTADGDLFDEEQAELSGEAIVDTLEVNVLDTLDVARTDFTVLRLKRDLPGSSNVGLIAIDKQPGSDADYNRTAGMDFSLSLAAGRPQPARLRRRNLDPRGGGGRRRRPAGARLPPDPLRDQPELPRRRRGFFARSRLRAAHRHPPLQGPGALPAPAGHRLDPPAFAVPPFHLPDGPGQHPAEPRYRGLRLRQSRSRRLARGAPPQALRAS